MYNASTIEKEKKYIYTYTQNLHILHIYTKLFY